MDDVNNILLEGEQGRIHSFRFELTMFRFNKDWQILVY